MTFDLKRLLLASTLLMGLPTTVQAQNSAVDSATPADDAAGEGDAIVVTGSRLSNPNLEQAAPIMAVSAKEIALTGQNNVENILKELPQVLPGNTSASNNPGDGTATADLRGLGSARTLVLVNGRRYVSYDTNQIVDLNTIPTALIERVDVVTGGKSAVYGSDAVSGVINFVTKQDFDGVQANANYRLTDSGDGGQYTGGILAGKNFADGRGNITLYGEYSKRKAIKQSARKYTAVAQTDSDDGLVGGGSGTAPEGKVTLAGNPYKFGTDGSYSVYDSSTDAYNYATENYLQVPQKRALLSGQAHFEVSDHLTLYAEGQYVHNKVANQLAPTPLTGTYSLDTDSSFLAADSQALLSSYDTDGDGYTSAAVNRRLTEVGDRISKVDSKAYRALIGARGNIAGDWNYDVYASFSRTKRVERQYGNVSASAVRQALRTTYDSSGNLVCSDTSNGCVPLNIFGAGNISQAAADFIAIDTVNRSTITEKVVSGAITNDSLFDLGAGYAGLAIGAEYRSEHGSFNPDEALSSGDVIGFNASEPTAGGYNVKELFAEINVPLLADRPFIDRLEFNGAARYSYYSTAAKSVGTFSAGLVWAPVKDISLRAQFSRAVRAPTVNDLYSGSAQNFETAADPCSDPDVEATSSLIASCAAAGVPTNAIGSDFSDTQIDSSNGGNTKLREETANTYTFGAIFQPQAIPGLSLTVDYYHIKIDNFITAAGTSNIIAACYGTKDNGYTPYNTSYCSLLPRDSNTYAITGAVDNLANSGGVKTDGIDFDAQYTIPLGFGANNASKLNLRVSGTRLLNWTYKPIAALSDLVVDCTGSFGLLCGNVYAKWRLNSRVTWATEDTTVSLAWRHLSSVKDDDASTTYTGEKIKPYDYFDLTASFDIAKRFTWNIGMNNMFNKKPPILGDNQEQANTYPSTYDVYGRTFFTGITVDF
jgi:outer membrane receptor protein involved in Fe transport